MKSPLLAGPFVRKPGLTVQELPDQSCVLFDPAADTAYPLNPVGALLWESCDGKSRCDALVGGLVSIFDIPREQLESDTRAFLEQLLELGLIQEGAEA